LSARVTPANHGDAETMVDSVVQAQMNLDAAGAETKILSQVCCYPFLGCLFCRDKRLADYCEPHRPRRGPATPAVVCSVNGVLGIEAGEVLADNFARLVPLDAFRSGVPGRQLAPEDRLAMLLEIRWRRKHVRHQFSRLC